MPRDDEDYKPCEADNTVGRARFDKFELPLTKTDRTKLVKEQTAFELSRLLYASGKKFNELSKAEWLEMLEAANSAGAAALDEYHKLVDYEVLQLNRTWSLVLNGNDAFICSQYTCPETGRRVWRMLRQNEFLLAESHWAARPWLKSHLRCTYPGGFVFDPSTTKPSVRGAINLWRGWSVKPEPGDWSPMEEHIREVLAGGNEKYASYIIRWLAWMIQNPDRQAECALVFRGLKGSGRGSLGRPIRGLCHQHGVHISSPKLLTGDFNNHLRDCIFLFADEALWAGDKTADGKLKQMITEDTLPIEGKGRDAISVKNRLHIMMASNEKFVVPATHDERRYAVFDTSPHKIGDRDYFTRLNDLSYLPAMLHALQNMDLGEWHPRWDIPQTKALRDQIRLNEPSYRRVLRGMLHAGRPADGDLVLDDFKTACKKIKRNANEAEIESFAQSIPRRVETVGRKGKKRLTFYKLAALGVVRDWFDRTEEWEDDLDDWVASDGRE